MVLREADEALNEDAPRPGDTEAEAGFIAAGGKVDDGLHPRVLNFEVNGEGEEGVEQGFDRPGLAEEFADVGVGAEVADFDAACLFWRGRDGGREGGQGEMRGGTGEGGEGVWEGRDTGAWGNKVPAT